MKKLAFALLAILMLTSATTWAQKRIKFPPGRTTVILQGSTTGGPSESGGMNPITHVLRAQRPDHDSASDLSEKERGIRSLRPGFGPGRRRAKRQDWSGELPKNGDYEIIVFPEDEKTNTTFTLEITTR